MRRLIYVLLALSVVLIGLAFAQNSTDKSSDENTVATSWMVDLSEAGFGKVKFELPPDPDLWGGRLVYANNIDSSGVCHVYYDPEADPSASFEAQPEMENAPGFKAEDYKLFYHLALFACANGGERPEVVGDPDNLYLLDWMDLYIAQCGESYYRLGWPGEPETTTDLACVPNFNAFMAGYDVEP